MLNSDIPIAHVRCQDQLTNFCLAKTQLRTHDFRHTFYYKSLLIQSKSLNNKSDLK